MLIHSVAAQRHLYYFSKGAALEHVFDDKDIYQEGEYAKRICDFCGVEADWTEPVEDMDENGE